MFSQEINSFVDDIKKESNTLVRSISEHVLNSLIAEPPIGTPRDTHTAKNSWRFSSTNDITIDEGEASKEKAANALAQQNISKQLLSNASLDSNDMLFIVNPMNYISLLNYEKQSLQSNMFVEAAIQSAKQNFK